MTGGKWPHPRPLAFAFLTRRGVSEANGPLRNFAEVRCVFARSGDELSQRRDLAGISNKRPVWATGLFRETERWNDRNRGARVRGIGLRDVRRTRLGREDR